MFSCKLCCEKIPLPVLWMFPNKSLMFLMNNSFHYSLHSIGQYKSYVMSHNAKSLNQNAFNFQKYFLVWKGFLTSNSGNAIIHIDSLWPNSVAQICSHIMNFHQILSQAIQWNSINQILIPLCPEVSESLQSTSLYPMRE